MSNKISAVVISLNEEHNIERCLTSLSSIADEMLLIDSFSTDKTAEIAERCGAKVLQRKWDGYSKTKNWGHQQAQHPYILSLDADEAIDASLAQQIAKLKSEGLKDVYKFNRKNFIGSQWVKHGGWYPDAKIRLFPVAIEWKGNVHETLLLPENIKTVKIEGNILHYSYQNIDELSEKAHRYAKLWAAQHAKNRKGSLALGWFKRVVKFIEMYVIKAGWKDGELGWQLARVTAQERYARQQYLVELNKKAT